MRSREKPVSSEDATGADLEPGTPVALVATAIALGALLVAVFAHSAIAAAIAVPVATAAALVAGCAIRSENNR